MIFSYISRVVHPDPQQPCVFTEAPSPYAHVQEWMDNQTSAMYIYIRSLFRYSQNLKSLQGLARVTIKAGTLIAL